MESVRKASDRMKKFPLLLKECHETASSYARCVALKENVLKGDCDKEFVLFKQCLTKAAIKIGSKI